MASVVARRGRTSIGTWYVAPPTRRLFTSSAGRTFSTARLSVGTGSPLVLRSISLRAWYTICSAVERLPCWSTLLTSWVTTTERWTGSGRSSRRGAGPLRGIRSALLRAVTAACLLAVRDATGVERTAHDLVPDTGKVLHPTATHEHDGVLLEV